MNEKNPWTTLDSRVVYENPWMRVREDNVIRPDGKKGIYGVVETHIATGVIALTEQKEVYLVGQYRYPTQCYSWEIVEGGTDSHETPLAAAQRELREEAGITARDWSELGGEVHLSNCITAEVARLFLATGLGEVPASPEGTEVLEVRKVPLVRALQMVDDGEVVDAVSIIALLRLDRLLRTVP